MKTLSFNQIQIRVFAIIVVLFTSIVFNYRVWVQLPQLESTMIKLSERELTSLIFGIERINKPLLTLNYDYAVWDATYQFAKQPNTTRSQKYLAVNYPKDTFTSLKVDGAFIFDNQSNLLYAKGLNYKTNQNLNFEFYDFERFPENKIFTSDPYNGKEVKPVTGFISTKFGPAFVTSTPILLSDKSTPSQGFMVFIRLIDQSFVSELPSFTSTPVTMERLSIDSDITEFEDWNAAINMTELTPFTQRVIRDTKAQPVLKITVYHTNTKPPSIWGVGMVSLIVAMVVLLATVYLLLAGFIIRPVQRLANNVKAMDRKKRYKELPRNYIIAELRKISFHFNALMGTVQRQNTILSQQVHVDELTQIANRRAFELHLETQLQLLRRQNIGFTLILADIDYFKQYNDSLGHVAGDEALISIATLLAQHFKRAGDICARFGGEEFIMLYSDIPEAALTHKMTEILAAVKALAIPHPASQVADYVTVSFGVCQVSTTLSGTNNAGNVNSFMTGKQLTEIADKALYQAKQRGRNQYYQVAVNANETSTVDITTPKPEEL
ncbi:sensor domain-containing diguanylate cyclase [Shewanella youngdeokensis]|uniref:diguanylate cyclase n=1 Tax=Shewanella youngdeokensis TaxID=2999068 RepID=A0ABZ0K2R8_9GAMM|nr:diguanylate cyclase [Shewanella sp. DAU334]